MSSDLLVTQFALHADDYTSTTVDLAFNMSTTEICTNITLEEDLTVESVEEFRVRLSSSDPAVSFAMDEARVFIGDATSKCTATGPRRPF